jgi:hypothetical protein
MMYYHGLTAAAARAGLPSMGAESQRMIIRALNREETVLAVGTGHFREQPGWVVLTDKRVLIIEAAKGQSQPVLETRLDSIEGVSLGKRISGETLKVVLPQGPVVISRLGHGEGHGIVRTFREVMKERARVQPIVKDG